MNLDNYIKTVLSGVKIWAQSTFAKKSDIKDMYYDHRTFVTTKEVTVNGTVGAWGYVKVSDTLDFDIDKVVSVSRYGNDGVDYANQPVVIYKDYGVDVIVTTDDFCLGVYFESQTEIDDWGGPTSWTPGLYMYMFLDEGDLCSIAYSFTYANGELRKIDPKYIDIPLATVTEPGAVHPWINNEYGQDVWMNPENGELYTYNNSYTLPVATANTLGGVKPVTKTGDMTQEVGVDNAGKLYVQRGVGYFAGSNGSEIFNDYVNNAVAWSDYAHAEGSYTSATGDYSHAEGYHTAASGECSHAEGFYTSATGDYSHAEGGSTEASERYSHAEGNTTKASGFSSHAEGQRSEASGNTSHAEGQDAKATGACSHAEGSYTEAYGSHSHAEGYSTKSLGSFAHTEGLNTTASGQAAHAEGDSSQASGTGSHAEGVSSKASGYGSHAEGEGTLASSRGQHVQGFFNVEDAKQLYLHIVGNGDAETRSNAHTLDQHGNAWFAGDIYVGSTSGTNKDDGSQKLVTMADVEASIDESIQEALADFEVGNATISWDSF